MAEPARFWAVDLHVHTPASRDVLERQYGTATPNDVVQAALAAGLHAIAVTDHNTASWCADVAAAAVGTKLTVLPGIEITTSEGHLLALWEAGTPTHILDECLTKMDIGADDRGRLDISASVNLAEAAKIIASAGGLAIAAHADQEKGLLKLPVAAHQKRTLLDTNLAAVEIVDLSKVQEVQRKVGDARELAFVRGSDAIEPGKSGHRLAAIGNRRTWIKAASPDLCGLRHAFQDPALRVRLDDPSTAAPHPYIMSISIAGGFLDGTRFELSPDLNCLVGGTGTGKSLALECIRYVLHQQADENAFPKIAEEVRSRLNDALGQNSTITIEVLDRDGTVYVLERSYSSSSPAPCLVRRRLPDGDLAPGGLEPDAVLRINAFSQGEALEYARERVGRMALVDSALDLSDVDGQIRSHVEALETNGVALLRQRELVKALTQRLGEKPALAERLTELEALFDTQVVKNQRAWQVDDTAIASVLSRLPSAGSLKLDIDLAEHAAELDENTDLVDEAKAIVADARSVIEQAKATVDAALIELAQKSADLKGRWAVRYAAFKTELDRALEAMPGNKSLVALRGQLEKVQSDLLEIEEAERRLREEAKPQLAALANERENILKNLMKARQARREMRRARIRDLNSRTSGIVKMDLPATGDRAAFRTQLNILKVGSRVSEKCLDAIAANLHPAHGLSKLGCWDRS